MGYIFFFKCSSCDYYIVTNEGASGWIDNEGNLGRAVINGTILGKPKGGYINIWYDERLCTSCGKIYHVVDGDTHGIDLKPQQFMEEMGRNISVLVNANECPECKIKLKQGREVLNFVINRDKCWKPFDLNLDLTKDDMLKCPKCKNEFLLYDKFWRAD